MSKKNPEQRIIAYSGEYRDCILKDTSDFVNPFSPEEQKTIIGASGGKRLTNDVCVRLESVEDGICKLAKVHFFDFMCTNYLHNRVTMDRTLKKEKSKLETILSSYKKKTFEDVLAIKEMANLAAISIMLFDSDFNVLIAGRAASNAISSASYAASVTGSLCEEDVEYSDPFLAAAYRELREELGIQVPLEFQGIVQSVQKLQPIILYKGYLEGQFSLYRDTFRRAKDFHKENLFMIELPAAKLLSAVASNDFTDVAAYQAYKLMDATRNDWFKACKHSVILEKYIVQF